MIEVMSCSILTFSSFIPTLIITRFLSKFGALHHQASSVALHGILVFWYVMKQVGTETQFTTSNYSSNIRTNVRTRNNHTYHLQTNQYTCCAVAAAV